MRKRTIQVKMVKTPKDDDTSPDETDETLEGKAAIIGYYAQRIVATIGKSAVAYVVVDTLREVVIARATKS